MPRRGIGLELLVLPERSEGKQEFRLNSAFPPSGARGERRTQRSRQASAGVVCWAIRNYVYAFDPDGLLKSQASIRTIFGLFSSFRRLSIR